MIFDTIKQQRDFEDKLAVLEVHHIKDMHVKATILGETRLCKNISSPVQSMANALPIQPTALAKTRFGYQSTKDTSKNNATP